MSMDPAGALFIGATFPAGCFNSRKRSARRVYGPLTFRLLTLD